MSLTPMKAIRARCLGCSNQQPSEVRKCSVKSCPLWPYRLGKRPATVERHAQRKEATKDEA